MLYPRRDDVSHMTTWRKQTVTQNKRKMQKRFLTNNGESTQEVCLRKSRLYRLLFCTYRPFWVVAPMEADRETCQCKTQENLKFMTDSIYSRGLLSSKNSSERHNEDASGDKCLARSHQVQRHNLSLPKIRGSWPVPALSEKKKL